MQQINLYSEILKHQQQQSGIQLVAISLGVLLGLFLLFSVYLFWNNHATEVELRQAQLSLDQQQSRFNGLLAKRPNHEPNPQLLIEIGQWESNLKEATEALQMLASRQSVMSKGFSLYLKALATHPNPEVWLTAVHINGQNEEITLEGSTFKPGQIPQILQRFQDKPAFKGLTFAKLVMQQSAQMPGQMDFRLSSSDKPSNEKDHVQ